MPKLGGGYLHFSRSFRDGKTARAFQTRKGRELSLSVAAVAPITFAGFLLDYIAPHSPQNWPSSAICPRVYPAANSR